MGMGFRLRSGAGDLITPDDSKIAMKIAYTLTRADLEIAEQRMQKNLIAQRKNSSLRFLRALLLGGFIGLGFSYLQHDAESNVYTQAIQLLVALTFFGSIIWLAIWSRSKHKKVWLESLAGEQLVEFTAAGFSCSSARGIIFYDWTELIALDERADYCLFYLRRDAVLTIPSASFASPQLQVATLLEVRHLWAAHPDNAARDLPAAPRATGFFSVQALWANLCTAARVIFFRPFNWRDFKVSRSQLAYLVVLDLAWLALVDFYLALPVPRFSWYGVSHYALSLLLTLLAAALVSSRMAYRASLLALLVMTAASSLLISVVYLLAWFAQDSLPFAHAAIPMLLYVFAAIWAMAALFRIVQALYFQPAPSALYLSSVFAVFTMLIYGLVPHQNFFYDDAPSEQTDVYQRARELDVEAIFYHQPQLVEQQLASLLLAQKNKTNLYFVGFAGQAEEQVFGNEVRFAKNLLDQRFASAGHSIALINSMDTVQDAPLANQHNLDAVLQGVAARMDKKRDVLFLYLSSHGAKDQQLSVSFWPLRLNNLKAETLKEMLDNSGIQNRVIVVSACYSGGFLDALKDDNSLIMTASSRDHVSYGCGDATQYTYFGESYFVQSLAHGNSFISAFSDAQERIAAREKSEGKDSSAPQIHIGTNIEAKLNLLEVKPAAQCPPRTICTKQ